ncbi:MAG: hypothetical protein ACRD2L_08820 [Terriglobia bacterium]
MAGKTARSTRSWNEKQLDFPFLVEADPATGAVAESKSTASLQFARSTGRARGLASALANARSTLLGAPIEEVSAQLLPLLEFCEAALTRALDTVALRNGADKLFSTEEYRSLRGIGQAQWLLAERYSDQEREPVAKKPRKGRKSRPKQ